VLQKNIVVGAKGGKMDIVEIVTKYLQDNGYDGLFCEDECACLLPNVFPCGESFLTCEAGYKIPCPEDCGEHSWHIGPLKEGLESSQ